MSPKIKTLLLNSCMQDSSYFLHVILVVVSLFLPLQEHDFHCNSYGQNAFSNCMKSCSNSLMRSVVVKIKLARASNLGQQDFFSDSAVHFLSSFVKNNF